MTVFYLQHGAELEHLGPRIGFTVGKALGGAVQRNRIRRRLREAVRLNGFSPDLNVDVVINPKKPALNVKFTLLQSEIAKAFQVIQRSVAKGT